jgi:hypothetical protein
MLSGTDLEALVSLPGKFYTDGLSDAPSFYPHVLLAEDNECTLRVVQQLLIHCGYRGNLGCFLCACFPSHVVAVWRQLYSDAVETRGDV